MATRRTFLSACLASLAALVLPRTAKASTQPGKVEFLIVSLHCDKECGDDDWYYREGVCYLKTAKERYWHRGTLVPSRACANEEAIKFVKSLIGKRPDGYFREGVVYSRGAQVRWSVTDEIMPWSSENEEQMVSEEWFEEQPYSH